VNLYYLFFGKGEIFLDPTAVYSSKNGENAINNADERQFLWYFRRSPILKYLILGHYRSIMQKEKESIEREVEEYRAKEE